MTPSSPPPFRLRASPAARALRLQRIYARIQDGAAYAEIAAEEGVSRERLRQIIRAATTRGRQDDRPDHSRMQIARLTPALRLAAAGVAEGDTKAIPLMLQIMDRLDRYSDPDEYFSSPPPQTFMTWRPRKSSKGGNGRLGVAAGPSASRPPSRRSANGNSTGTSRQARTTARRAPLAHCHAAKPLKTFKTTMGSSCQKLAWIWVWRHVCLGLAPRSLGVGATPVWG